MRIDNTVDGLVAWLSGEIDHHAARHMREQIDAAVERYKPQRLRLDFSGIQFMDSSGIGLIMGRYRLIQMYGGQLELSGVSPRIRKVIQLAGLDKLPITEIETESEVSSR